MTLFLLLRLQELAERYAPLLHLPAVTLGGALETVRLQALHRGRGNATFRETQVATLELMLPRVCKEVHWINAAPCWPSLELQPDLCHLFLSSFSCY